MELNLRYNWYQMYESTEDRPVLDYTIEDLDFVVYVGKMFHAKQKIYFPSEIPAVNEEDGIAFFMARGLMFVGLRKEDL